MTTLKTVAELLRDLESIVEKVGASGLSSEERTALLEDVGHFAMVLDSRALAPSVQPDLKESVSNLVEKAEQNAKVVNERDMLSNNTPCNSNVPKQSPGI